MIATLAVQLAGVYVAIGALFAAWFAWRGAGRLDPVARYGSIGFRLLIVPGATVLWPVLLRLLVRGGGAPMTPRHDGPA